MLFILLLLIPTLSFADTYKDNGDGTISKIFTIADAQMECQALAPDLIPLKNTLKDYQDRAKDTQEKIDAIQNNINACNVKVDEAQKAINDNKVP